MDAKKLFAQALGDLGEWAIISIEFKVDEEKNRELHIHLDFPKGTKFADSEGALCRVHDTDSYTWRHLNFFQHRAYLHARVPRIITGDGSVKTVTVPWAKRNGGFTALFECYVMELIKLEMTPSAVAELVGEYPGRIWYLFNRVVEKEGLPNNDDSGITKVGVDETSSKKGHNYITIAVDMEEERVFKVVEGKDSAAVKAIAEHLAENGSPVSEVTDVCIDMSPAFIKGAGEEFPNAKLTFDRFHVTQAVNKAMDKVRRLERKEFEALKGHKYTFLRNVEDLKDDRLAELVRMINLYPTLGTAYRLKELFRELWDFADSVQAKTFLDDWYRQVEKSGIFPFQEAMKTIRNHEDGILQAMNSQLTNGILEGINSLVQLAKKRARGFRNPRYFRNMIYFLCGKLKFNYPYNFA